MTINRRPDLPADTERTPGAMLAGAVIKQALHDASAVNVSPAVRAQARSFLNSSDALRFWCHVANLSMPTIVRMADDFLAEQREVRSAAA